jgi:hypothetical protein
MEGDNILESLKSEKYLNQDIINHLNNFEDNLDKELQKIDEQYDNEIECLELMEEKNIELLENIHREYSEEKEQEQKKHINKKFKTNKFKVLDSKLIMSTIPNLKKIEGHDAQLIYTINIEEILLSDKKLLRIENLDIFQKLKELHLQRNYIETIEGLIYNINLQVLNLNNNYIKKISGIKQLINLKILNLGDNIITTLDLEEIPEGVVYLYLFDNLFFDKLDIFKYRFECIRKFKGLERLDGLTISEKERRLLTDVKDIEKNLMVQRQLDYLKKYYTGLKVDRRFALNDYMGSLEHIGTDGMAYEGLKSDINNLKQKSKDRTKSFIDLSDERMDSLKRNLEEISSKIKENSMLDNAKLDNFKEKLRKAFKLNEENITPADDFLKDL